MSIEKTGGDGTPGQGLVKAQGHGHVSAEQVVIAIVAITEWFSTKTSIRHFAYSTLGLCPRDFELIRAAAEPLERIVRDSEAGHEGALLLRHYLPTMPPGPERDRAIAVITQFLGEALEPSEDEVEPALDEGGPNLPTTAEAPVELGDMAGYPWTQQPMTKAAAMTILGKSESTVNKYLRGAVAELRQFYAKDTYGIISGMMKDHTGQLVRFKAQKIPGVSGMEYRIQLRLPEDDHTDEAQ